MTNTCQYEGNNSYITYEHDADVYIYALLVIIFSPAFLDKVKDKEFKQFGKDMCKIWSHLGRKVWYYYLSVSYEGSLKLTSTCV